MKMNLSALVLMFTTLSISPKAHAILEELYKVKGSDPIESTLEKLGAPRGKVAPFTFKVKATEIKVDTTPDKILSLDFTPAHPFTISDSDLFEKIETRKKGDIVNDKLIVSDPKTGRIFYLNRELEVYQLDLIKPWESKKSELKSLKTILSEMSSGEIVKRVKIKKEKK